MKTETLVKIDKYMEKISDWNFYVLTAIPVFIAALLCWIFMLFKRFFMRIIGKTYDSALERWVTKEERDKEIKNEKIKNREIDLVNDNHITPQMNARFFFFEKRKITIPYDQLVYVETDYNDKIHRFFEDNAEWLEMWQKWHGWDIVKLDYEDIKEGMFYPQDFSVFRHGFLWNSATSSWDEESEIYGNIHYYYDIDPDSDIPIKEQMDRFIRKIFECVDCT